MSSLFEVPTGKDIDLIIEQRVAEILNGDPQKAIEIYQKRNQLLEKEIFALKPKADKYDSFLDASGFVDCRSLAHILKIKYFPENSKTQKIMGGTKLTEMLRIEGITYKSTGGYSLQHRYFNSGYGKTIQTEKNGFMTKTVVFTPKGVDWLKERFDNDNKIWKVTNGKLKAIE